MRGVIPQKVKGFRDIDPKLNFLRNHIIESASKVYKSYGYEHWDTPLFEYADCLGKYMPDENTVEQGVYSFRNPEKEEVYDTEGNRMVDEDGKFILENHFLSMRYDLTAPLSRLYSEPLWLLKLRKQLNPLSPPLFRRYQYGLVFRYEEKLDPGRFREFMQLDFDSVGTNDTSSDAETCMILSDALEAIGMPRGSYTIKVSDRKILKGILNILSINDEETEQSILRIIDKQDKIGLSGVEAELGKGRKDSSGAFNQGLNIEIAYINKIIAFLESFSEINKRSDIIQNLLKQSENNPIMLEGIDELTKIDNILDYLCFDENRVIFDPTLVRGMSYYTGPVFEVISNLTYKDEKGTERRVGSICGGGRYDSLVERLLGFKVPATGASIGVDRLAELLTLTNSFQKTENSPVIIIAFDENLMPEYQKIARQLRENNIDTEIYYGMNRGLKKQLAYADKKNSPIAILLGEDENNKGVVTIRNLKLGKELSANLKDKAEWKEKAQFEVPKNDIVMKIKEIIG